VNTENWILGNYVATVQLLALFAEVDMKIFLLGSCVCVFVCDMQLSSVFSMVAYIWFCPGELHTLGVGAIHKIIS